MNTRLILTDKALELYRYPAESQHKSEQAWDAADEYMLGQLTAESGNLKIWILNDDCGALCCALADHTPRWIGDSLVSQLACRQNLNINNLAPDSVQFFDSLSIPAENPDLVLIKIPRTLALLEHQLCQLQSATTPRTRIIAGARVNQIHSSTLALFEKYLGPVTTSLAKKKARLIFCQPQENKHLLSPYPTCWKMPDMNWLIHNHANVFARQQLDIGARFMLKHLPEAQGKKVIDLGCGNGVLGMAMLCSASPDEVSFVDESFMAVASASQNVAHNLPEHLRRCTFVVSNCLDQIKTAKAHIILCNPPFHQQQRITDHVAWQMFKQARDCLYPGGELRIIGNRHLDYHHKLKRLFGGYHQVAANNKFSILSAIRR
ncbi:methyltransferase [Lacimicrobium alkaliphilum]|uniref:Ribosomal RNA large subunit methyltransferase G n=1 Tax=Lacimicrobium alkaliphilum TaxID=1526571 RepID=A0A0U3AWY7_9ALTE|nr:methyltransferase [Lacimicrobium alkaliphilum]ALS97480.1 23S rRNA methyltransferase [Lacimicrobium alkaliphilum]